MRLQKSLHFSVAATNILMKQSLGIWLKTKRKKERLATVLYNLFEGIRIGAVCLEAFLPSTSKKILDQIGTQERDYLALDTFGRMEQGYPGD